MKKLTFSLSIFLILITAFLFRCAKEKEAPIQEQEVFFALTTPDAKIGSDAKGLSGYNLTDARKIVLTIQNADGSPTKYTSSDLDIYQMNGAFFSQKLILKTGSYRLTEFLIMDSTENVIFATPLKGSYEAQNLTYPLPINFEVFKDISTPVIVEVISTENKSPEDFGLVSFGITEVKTFDFLITVIDKTSDNVLSARLTVTSGNYSYVQMLDSMPNNRVSVKDSSGMDSYELNISRSGYVVYNHTYSKDSLKLFNNNGNNSPLVIKLEKKSTLLVTTTNVKNITSNSSISGGNVISDDGSTVTSRGVCWATTSNPTLSNSITSDGSGIGSFESSLSGLQQGTTYHVRAYASNIAGTSYGNEISFTTNSMIVPTFRDAIVLSINVTTALFDCLVNSQFEKSVTAAGVCWATTPNPTLDNSFTSDWEGDMAYRSNITGLNPSTVYYVREYATDSAGTGYSEQIQITTLADHTGEIGTVGDIDGNIYKTIGIGSQIWMAENLKTTRFNDGTEIPLVSDNIEWMILSTPAFCWYNNDAATYKDTYGALYNWYIFDVTNNGGKNACPVGWHLYGNDWGILAEFVSGRYGSVGGNLKESGTVHWSIPNRGATNETGFTALPGGSRYEDFSGIGYEGYFWSSSHGPSGEIRAAEGHALTSDESGLHGYTRYDKRAGFSVRCVKD